MYKVILIDDEPIIVQGLARSVPWEKYGCQVVDTAGDGLEGKRLIEKHAPDMVFLDICMPQMRWWRRCSRNTEIPRLRSSRGSGILSTRNRRSTWGWPGICSNLSLIHI